jgi:hypothetical protein
MALVELNKYELESFLLVVSKKIDKLENAGKTAGSLNETYDKLKKAQKEEAVK